MPSIKAISVITAPAAMKNTTDPASKAALYQASWRERRVDQSHTSHATSSPPRKCGRRAANSLIPNRLKLTAVIQNDSGGLPQNGTPQSNHGVIQSFNSTILRAISA